MFERLGNYRYWKAMVQGNRDRQYAVNIGNLLGWEVWVMDGKALLFKGNRVKRCCYAELCYQCRKWFGCRVWLYSRVVRNT